MKEFKVSLAAARVNKGMTTSMAARRLGKTQGWLTLIENGRRELYASDLFKLCDLYEIPVENILLPKKNTKKKHKKMGVFN